MPLCAVFCALATLSIAAGSEETSRGVPTESC